MNISSVIIKADKKCWDGLKVDISKIDGVETHIFDKESDIIIATIMADNTDQEITRLGQIERLPGVIGVNMHYSYSEESQDRLSDEEILAHIEKIEDAKEIRYKGSVNNWI